MSALAILSRHNNCIVAGSDSCVSTLTKKLEKYISVYYGHKKNNIIRFKPDLVVYTGAIKSDNPELKFAQDNGIECMERSKYLGELCKNYERVIAISGTHGKTTTTAMIGEIFIKAGYNPTIHIGGEVVNLKGNLYIGDTKYFITEACEYKKSFECIHSDMGIINNIECDHMDCYKDYDDLVNSFKLFLSQSNMGLIRCDNVLNTVKTTKVLYTFGDNNSNYYVDNIAPKDKGYTFDVYKDGILLSNFKINVMGRYNIENALVAIAVANIYGIHNDVIYTALENFNGVLRRNELLGKINNIPVYADYCHHPTEIKDSIQNYKEHYKKILCIFQPHTYSRTIKLLNEFVKCFDGVNKLVIYSTYPAREEYNYDGSETCLYKHLKHKNKELIIDKTKLINYVQNISDYDVVLILGAGDIYNIVKDNLFN